MGRVPVDRKTVPAGGRAIPAVYPTQAERLGEAAMVHDDTTYMDEEGMGWLDLGDDGEHSGVTPVHITAGGRTWTFSEEDWGGWDAE